MMYNQILGYMDMILLFVHSRCGMISSSGMEKGFRDLLNHNYMQKLLSRIPKNPSKDAKCIIMLHGV